MPGLFIKETAQMGQSWSLSIGFMICVRRKNNLVERMHTLSKKSSNIGATKS